MESLYIPINIYQKKYFILLAFFDLNQSNSLNIVNAINLKCFLLNQVNIFNHQIFFWFKLRQMI